jgi:peroxiredoxin
MRDEASAPLTGDQAPEFTLPRSAYQAFSLSDVRGRPAVLVFYPGDWEPVSSQQLYLYEEYLPELDRFGAALVGISVDSVWSHLAYARELGLSFPLLSDFRPRGKVAHAYRVYLPEEARSSRALFVIDPEGAVRWSRVVPTNLNPGVEGMLSALTSLDGRVKPVEPTRVVFVDAKFHEGS